ncbi:MAG: hypothetical protein WCN95_00655 [bacterium]
MTTKTLIGAAAFLVCIQVSSAPAQSAKSSTITGGIRQYVSHPEDTASPFGDGDVSYLLAYEYHEAKAYWQFGVSFTPNTTMTSVVLNAQSIVPNIESIVTPQIRLVFEENLLLLGIGVLKHYVQGKEVNHWSDLYWELEAGLHVPFSSTLELRGVAYYSFREWGDVGDFDASQLEFGLEVAYKF